MNQKIGTQIYDIRGERVMLDYDLAALYEVSTKRLNEQVSRNPRRFPIDFMFVLNKQEFINLKSQFATSSSEWGGRRTPPRAFTEHGIAMLSSVLQSDRAIEVNIAIMRAFAQIRKVRISAEGFEKKIDQLEARVGRHDAHISLIFDAIRQISRENLSPRKRIKGLSHE